MLKSSKDLLSNLKFFYSSPTTHIHNVSYQLCFLHHKTSWKQGHTCAQSHSYLPFTSHDTSNLAYTPIISGKGHLEGHMTHSLHFYQSHVSETFRTLALPNRTDSMCTVAAQIPSAVSIQCLCLLGSVAETFLTPSLVMLLSLSTSYWTHLLLAPITTLPVFHITSSPFSAPALASDPSSLWCFP